MLSTDRQTAFSWLDRVACNAGTVFFLVNHDENVTLFSLIIVVKKLYIRT